MNKFIFTLLSITSAVFILSAEKKSTHEITISGNDTMQFDIKNLHISEQRQGQEDRALQESGWK